MTNDDELSRINDDERSQNISGQGHAVNRVHAVSSVQPSAHLPKLSEMASFDAHQRRIGLNAWIAWVNGNRHRLDADTQRTLDGLLQGLDREVVSLEDDPHLDAQFDAWLDAVVSRAQDDRE